MKITLEDGPVSTFLLKAGDGRSILIQTDYDYPKLRLPLDGRRAVVAGKPMEPSIARIEQQPK